MRVAFNSNFISLPFGTADRNVEPRTLDSNLRVSVSFMTNGASLRNLNKEILLRDFTALVDKDRRDTATMLAYIGEIRISRILSARYSSSSRTSPTSVRSIGERST